MDWLLLKLKKIAQMHLQCHYEQKSREQGQQVAWPAGSLKTNQRRQ